jgi:hypothetical protein
MNTRSLLVRLSAAFTITCVLAAGQLFAQTASYIDATGDIDGAISNGGGTLDIVSMEVSETATDLVFTLTVNGNISSTDWGNFMIGIANTKLPDPRIDRSRMKMTLEKVDGSWRASKVELP